MRYKIESSISLNKHELLEEYPCLVDFGYTLEGKQDTCKTWIRDENGKKMWQEVPCTVYIPYIFINSIEEFDKLATAVGHPLIYCNIITDYNPEPSIEIYDGYRE